ncbi:MAG: DUF4410 domain-containing protein [Nitrospirota bacterium]
MKKYLLISLLLVFCFACSSGRVKTSSAVDCSTIVLKDFSLEGTAIQENVDVKAFAGTLPPKFSEMVKEYLVAMKVSQKIVIEKAGEKGSYENPIIVDGSFTKITAGSTAARLLVGFGAGSSTVGAEYTIKDSSGKELGKFKKNSHTASGVRGIYAIESDARYLAKYVATTIKNLIK